MGTTTISSRAAGFVQLADVLTNVGPQPRLPERSAAALERELPTGGTKGDSPFFGRHGFAALPARIGTMPKLPQLLSHQPTRLAQLMLVGRGGGRRQRKAVRGVDHLCGRPALGGHLQQRRTHTRGHRLDKAGMVVKQP